MRYITVRRSFREKPSFGAVLLLCMFALGIQASAQRNTVRVEFHLTDGIYASELGPQQVALADKAFQSLFIEQLQRKIGFLHFSGDLQANPTYTLLIELGDPNRLALDSSHFHVSLKGPNGNLLPKKISWVFRPSTDGFRAFSNKAAPTEKIRDINLVGESDGEPPGELRQRFAEADFDGIVADLLSNIPVATQAELKEKPPDPRWELPLHRGDTCMDLHSRFRISHSLQFIDTTEDFPVEVEAVGPADGAADAMLAPISARLPDGSPQAQSVARLVNPHLKQVQVKGVYVLMYRSRDVGCAVVIPPSDSGLTRGGGQ
jgi:hypothetical protein